MKQKEFLLVINPFKDKLFRLAKRLLISTEEAEDATQEVLVKLWNKRNKLSSYKSVEALAVTITKNYCFDQLKSKRASNLQLVHSNYKDEKNDTVRSVEIKDELSLVEKMINTLPEQQRLIVQLRDIEEYEFSKIATLLDMNETAVRVALSRARKIIREKLNAVQNYGVKTS